MAYMNVGELNRSRQDLTRANILTEGKDSNIVKAFKELREKELDAASKEREFNARVF